MKHVVVRGGLNSAHRSEAAARLKNGGTALLPCGANYLVVSLQEAKLRPFGYPGWQRLVRDRRELETLWGAPSPTLVKLADAFMPGSLTLVVKTPLGRAGLMMPDSSFLAGIAGQLDAPLYFHETLDCASGGDLQEVYGERVDLWLDVGGVHLQPSTLVDVTRESALVERKGAVSILDIERVLGAKVRLGPTVVFSVLLVCTGNTCRSAMAHGILAQRLRDQRVVVCSAGTNTMPGLPATEGARQAAEALGIDLSQHFSTLLSASQIRDADLILVMESRHKRRVIELLPEAASRTFLLAEFSGVPRLEEIPDPLGSSLEVFREVAKIIAECLEKVAQDIEARIVAE
jgi:protein-tyrosine-phosphatase/tRNA A37 threonylcarbamoyladenosine synthetase subunit TsaC/SUA5/YrdC